MAGRDGDVAVGAGVGGPAVGRAAGGLAAVAALDPAAGPVGSAAARLDSLIEAWADTEHGAQLTELVRIRGLLGVGPSPDGVRAGDDMLAAAAARCDAITETLQTAGGSSTEIVLFRGLAATMRSWLDNQWPPTPSNFALRANAIAMATALVTGRVLPMDGGLSHRG